MSNIKDLLIKKELTDFEKLRVFEWAISSFNGSEWEIEKLHLDNILKDYTEKLGFIKGLELKSNKLESENKTLKEKVEELTKKIERLEKIEIENQTLKEKLGIVDSEWQFQRDLAWRINPITKKLEQYGYPLRFKECNVEHLHFIDHTMEKYSFDYYDEYENWKSFEMAVSLYELLCKKSLELEQKKEKKEKEQKSIEINDVEDMKKHFESCNISYYGLDYFDITSKFIIANKGKPFETKYFTGQCNMSSRTTANDYLKMFQDAKIIENIHKGFWKVIIK